MCSYFSFSRPTFLLKKKSRQKKTLTGVIFDNRLQITKLFSFSLMKKVVGQLLRYRPHFLWVFEVIPSIKQDFARYRLNKLLYVTKRYRAKFLYLGCLNKEYPK